jgi:hypothetical protein
VPNRYRSSPSAGRDRNRARSRPWCRWRNRRRGSIIADQEMQRPGQEVALREGIEHAMRCGQHRRRPDQGSSAGSGAADGDHCPEGPDGPPWDAVGVEAHARIVSTDAGQQWGRDAGIDARAFSRLEPACRGGDRRKRKREPEGRAAYSCRWRERGGRSRAANAVSPALNKSSDHLSPAKGR